LTLDKKKKNAPANRISISEFSQKDIHALLTELWLLNFFRNSELHGATDGRLARSLSGTELLTNITRHCATERIMLHAYRSDCRFGRHVDPKTGTIQEHFLAKEGFRKLTRWIFLVLV